MKLAEARHNPFAVPLNDLAYPPGQSEFYNRASQIHEFSLARN